MDTDELIRSELQSRQPAADAEVAWGRVLRRWRRRRSIRRIEFCAVLVLAALAIVVSVDTVADTGGADRLQTSDRAAEVARDPSLTSLRTIAGTLVLAGGLVPSPIPVEGDVDVVLDDGAIVVSTQADDEGRFNVQVPPGRYRLVGRSPQYQAGKAECSADAALDVESEDATDVLVVCRMK